MSVCSVTVPSQSGSVRMVNAYDKDIPVKNSATSPLFGPKANPNSTFPLPGPGEPKLRRSTPVGAVRPPRTKTISSANADFKPTGNTQEAPSTTVQNLRSRFCKLEKFFADEISTYTPLTAGIHSQYFFLYDKIRQLEPGNSNGIIWKIPSVKFVFDSARMARPSSVPLIEPAASFSSPISGLTPTDTTPSSNSTLMDWTRYWQVCFNFIHPLPWRIRQSSPMALLKAHPHWYWRSTGPGEHLDEDNPT